MYDLKPAIVFSCICLIFAACFAFVGEQDASLDYDNHAHYCEMVSIYKKTNGEYGWPNYQEANCDEKDIQNRR
jgi:hypothetical protein